MTSLPSCIYQVKIDRTRSFGEALHSTRRAVFAEPEVVSAVLPCKYSEVEIVLFNNPDLADRHNEDGYDMDDGKCFMSNDELAAQYVSRGLEPIHPIALAAIEECHPIFKQVKAYSTHWKDAKGRWCYARFHLNMGGPWGEVDSREQYWTNEDIFVGVRIPRLPADK